MVKSIFTGKIIEEKWEYGYKSYCVHDEGEWHLHDRYIALPTSVGSAMRYPREYTLFTRKIFLVDELIVKFNKGDKININEENVVIEDVIHNLDGSIIYHTNKEIERIVVISEKDAKRVI